MGLTIFERNPPNADIIRQSLAGSKAAPFWLEDVDREPTHPPLCGHQQAGLAIVGGGFLGLWSSVMAKERNAKRDVVLLEAGRIGGAASGRNGGFCEASLTHGMQNGQRRWAEEFSELERLGQDNLNELEATLERYQIDCDFERTGILEVAVEPYQTALLLGEGYLDLDAVRDQINSPIFLAGRWDKRGTAMLHPGKLVVGLVRVARELGVRFFEGSPVTSLSKGPGGKVHLATQHGTVQADRVILATNAFPSLLKRYRRQTIPIYDYVLMSEPISAAQMAAIGWRHRQGLADVGNQFHYCRLTKNNRILFGGYDAVYYLGGKIKAEYEERWASFELLASHFFTTFPQLEGLRFTHRWAGVIDTSSRFCACFADSMGGKVTFAAGFTGLGLGATRFAANVLLDKVEGLDTVRTRLRMVREKPLRFPPEPLTYAAVQSMRWSLDQADHNEGRRNLYLRVMDALGLGFNS
jgi:glycine/D-amino acid oxidase-like deaminating enzyme